MRVALGRIVWATDGQPVDQRDEDGDRPCNGRDDGKCAERDSYGLLHDPEVQPTPVKRSNEDIDFEGTPSSYRATSSDYAWSI